MINSLIAHSRDKHHRTAAFAGGGPPDFATVAALAASPAYLAYGWSAANGFLTKFADPASIPASSAQDCEYTTVGDSVIRVVSNTPFIQAIKFTIADGWGTLYANPAVAGTALTRNVTITTAGNAVAGGNGATPFVDAWAWSATGFGTKYANPAVVPAAIIFGLNYSPDDLSIVAAGTGGVESWAWTTVGGFGAKLASAAVFDANTLCMTIDSNSAFVYAGGSSTSPFMHGWNYSSTTGVGTKLTAAAAGGTFNQGLAVHPNNDALIGNVDFTPFIQAYALSSGAFGTIYANPATIPVAKGRDIEFNAAGDAVVTGTDTTPFINAWAWNSTTGFGAKYPNPSTLPPGTIRGNAWV